MGDISNWKPGKRFGITKWGSFKPGFRPQYSTHAKGGRAGFYGGGRTDLLEELGRVEAEPSNRNRRAEISRVHSELNKGYATGGRVGLKKGGKSDKNWIQDVNKSIKNRGTKGKCTPITKPGCTGRAKALALTFKKMARKRKKKTA